MRYLWGLLLVALGLGYLAASMGYIDYNQINQLFQWWPLILIFIGFDMLLKKYKYGWVGMIALTILAGFAIYDVSFAPDSYIDPTKSYRQTRELVKSNISVEKENGAKEAYVTVKTGAVSFDIKNITSKLVSGVLETNVTKPNVDSSISEGTQSVEIITESRMPRMMWTAGIKNKLMLSLNDQIPIFLKIASGASNLNFNLSDYIVSGVDIDAGASTIELVLGEKIQNGAKINIDSGASTVNITVPEKIGVRIKTESGLTTKNFEDFTQNGDYYENEAYKTAENRIDIEIKAGASTLNVKQK